MHFHGFFESQKYIFIVMHAIFAQGALKTGQGHEKRAKSHRSTKKAISVEEK